MLTLFFINILCVYLFTGVSLVFPFRDETVSLGRHFILGLSFTTLTLSFLSLITNIGPIFILSLLLLGVFGIIRNLKLVRESTLSLYGLSLFTFVAIISYFMGYDHYPFNSDTDIYHMNSVQWISQFGTVKGLANLNNRFGFNSSWHMLASLFEQSFLKGRSPWLMPCFSYIASFGYFLYEIIKSKELWRIGYASLILIWTITNILTWGFPSLHYDFFPLLLNAIVFYEVLKAQTCDTEASLENQFLWMLILSFAFILKQLGAMSLVFLFSYCLHCQYRAQKLTLRNIATISTLPILILVSWLTRNTILSGYPLFPSTLFAQATTWTIPVEKVIEIYKEVVGWARLPGPQYLSQFDQADFNWFPSWLKMQFKSYRFYLLAVLPLTGALILWVLNYMNGLKNYALFMFFWAASSIAFWFFSAPDIRFGDGFFFCLLGAGLAFNSYIKDQDNISNTRRRLLCFFLLTITAITTSSLILLGKRGPVNLLKIGRHGPGSIQLLTTDSNLKVWLPIRPHQCIEGNENYICPKNKELYKEVPACGQSPLPCTPFFNPNLKLMGTEIGEGFKL